MDRWEYISTIVWANLSNHGAKDAVDWVNGGWDDPPAFTPETVMPTLNSFGRNGWELVSLQPVELGKNYEVRATAATNAYLAVFKKRL